MIKSRRKRKAGFFESGACGGRVVDRRLGPWCGLGIILKDEQTVIWECGLCLTACGLLIHEGRNGCDRWLNKNKTKKNEMNIMKNKVLAGLIVAGLLMSAGAWSLMAQNGRGQGGNGCGYGAPPKTAEERAARQAACQDKNGGICPNGGPRTDCAGYGQGGQGKGQGKGNCARQGLRDGTGPRNGSGTCTNAPAQTRK